MLAADPSQRPFISFRGNTAHSTGYNWEHGGAIYFGGTLFYKTDPTDNVVKVGAEDSAVFVWVVGPWQQHCAVTAHDHCCCLPATTPFHA